MKGLHPIENGYWLLIDKPAGWTSFDVVAKVRGITRIRKAGHAGTLDPMATGLLVLGLGKATKLLHTGLEGGKSYEADVKLGLASPSCDLDAEWTFDTFVPRFESARIENALQQIQSRGYQVPPMVAALKKQGQPLHKLFRKGLWLELDERPVTIDELEILEYAPEFNRVRLKIAGGGGLYVRSVARDLGLLLGVPAALTALRRTSVGPWSIEEATDLKSFEERWPEEGYERIHTG